MSKLATVQALAASSSSEQLEIVRSMQTLQAELETLRKDLATLQARPDPTSKLADTMSTSAAQLAGLIKTAAILPSEIRDAQGSLTLAAKELARAAARSQPAPLWMRAAATTAAALAAAALVLAAQTFLPAPPAPTTSQEAAVAAEYRALLARSTPSERAQLARVLARPAPPPAGKR
jgi:hypothetical protein